MLKTEVVVWDLKDKQCMRWGDKGLDGLLDVMGRTPTLLYVSEEEGEVYVERNSLLTTVPDRRAT